MTEKQIEVLKDIQLQAEQLMKTDRKGLDVLRETISISAPAFMQMSTFGKQPSVDMLKTVTIRLLAVVLASQKE